MFLRPSTFTKSPETVIYEYETHFNVNYPFYPSESRTRAVRGRFASWSARAALWEHFTGG